MGRMETDLVGLAPLDLKTVNQIIVVVGHSGGRKRRRDLHLEYVNVIVVEVGLHIHIPCELGKDRILVNPGDPGGLDDLPVGRRILTVVVL